MRLFCNSWRKNVREEREKKLRHHNYIVELNDITFSSYLDKLNYITCSCVIIRLGIVVHFYLMFRFSLKFGLI